MYPWDLVKRSTWQVTTWPRPRISNSIWHCNSTWLRIWLKKMLHWNLANPALGSLCMTSPEKSCMRGASSRKSWLELEWSLVSSFALCFTSLLSDIVDPDWFRPRLRLYFGSEIDSLILIETLKQINFPQLYIWIFLKELFVVWNLYPKGFQFSSISGFFWKNFCGLGFRIPDSGFSFFSFLDFKI